MPLGPRSSTPTPSTSTSAPWARAVTARSEFGVFLLDGAADLVPTAGLEEALAEAGVAEEPGDPRQRLQVLAARVLGHHQQEEQVGGLTVDRVEVHARAAARAARQEPRDPGQLAVRDRDALADPGALELLAVDQHVEQ